ncbi:Hypothetical protein GbCGDNIH4_7239 [Granulibacter bethesdensis CGDNIH4]|nr:Hypothetical protein GbCGDNIH4_7239 [Granulibacter bethesdensis CGDNIH4]
MRHACHEKHIRSSLFIVSGVGLTGLIVACSVPAGPHYADIAARIPESSAGQSRVWIYRSAMPVAIVNQPSMTIDEHMLRTAMTGSTFLRIPYPPHIK